LPEVSIVLTVNVYSLPLVKPVTVYFTTYVVSFVTVASVVSVGVAVISTLTKSKSEGVAVTPLQPSLLLSESSIVLTIKLYSLPLVKPVTVLRNYL
jgi:hypothetical protein